MMREVQPVQRLKKPGRLPPPPPLPPKIGSSRSLVPCGDYASSECSDGQLSVQSMFTPNTFVQGANYTPTGMARSECGAYEISSPRCCYPTNSCCSNSSTCSYYTRASQSVPAVQKSRPKLCISPIPILRNNKKLNSKRKCKSSDYRRHIEQNIERVSKYLKERQIRVREWEEQQYENDEKKMHARILLKKNETRHLRSMRTRLSPKDFTEVRKLGTGVNGYVRLVRKNGTTDLYAMKKLRKSLVFQQNHMAHVMAERDILAEADNEWIVKLYYSFQDDSYLYFILEYIPGGDMMDLLCTYPVFEEHWARFYIAEISLALQYVHDMGFIHRDIKPDNILIDANGHIKLTDFGLCRGNRWTHDSSYYKEDVTQIDNLNNDEHPTITRALTLREEEHSKRRRALSLVGSPHYIAPEVLRGAYQKQLDSKQQLCDWWSVGVILYEMVVGYCPFMDMRKLKLRMELEDIRQRVDWQSSESLKQHFENLSLQVSAHDPPAEIQARILDWPRYLAFPCDGDDNSPPAMTNAKGERIYISEAAKDLIQGWLREPHDRYCQDGILDIKNHRFFAGINWDTIRSSPAPYKPDLSRAFGMTNFDAFPQPFLQDEIIVPPSGENMSMNDFTYRSFWKGPRAT